MSDRPLLTPETLPATIGSLAELEDLLCRPSQALIDDLARLDGDIMVLGVGGKMGPTVAGLAKAAAPGKRVIGVARFSEPGLKETLERRGVETIACDLMDAAQLGALPEIKNIVFMAGRKFGADGDLPLTWAMNVLVPAQVAQAFPQSRFVVFSTGCVYPFMGVGGPGATEETPPDPPGEYAQSCVGRERVFDYYAGRNGTTGCLFRLNYAIDMRYGVLHDIAAKIVAGEPVDVTMGHVNVIWQGDAAAQALRCLLHGASPMPPLNISGPGKLGVRDLAGRFARALGVAAITVGVEAPTAWLTDTSKAQALFGPPVVDLDHMIAWTADWVGRRMPSHGKPTKFEVRDGRY